ncbi:MAG: hypothetical protein P1Q69_06420 [Candidatus Thorarchaeota archaeon]|nr:hypothetical protein [Candidatus Thorarchaeota archaeon]
MKRNRMIPLCIALGLIMGLSVVVFASTTGYVSLEGIFISGEPLTSSVFSNLISESENNFMIKSNWSLLSESPLRYHLSLPLRTYTPNQTIDIAAANLENHISDKVSLSPNDIDIHSSIPNYLRDNIDFYQYINSNSSHHSVLIEIGVSNVEGIINEYTEYWNSNETIPPELYHQSPYSGQRINSTNAEQIASEFLSSRGYHFQNTSVHVRTSLALGKYYTSPSNYSVFEIVIRSQTNNLFPDRYADGVTLHISEYGGRITHFTAFLVELPDITELNLINPEVIHKSTKTSVPIANWNETSEFCGSYLRLVPCLDPVGSFALSWRFEYAIHSNNRVEFGEIGWNDAITGDYLFPGLYRSSPSISNSMNILLATILLGGLLVGLLALGFYNYRAS